MVQQYAVQINANHYKHAFSTLPVESMTEQLREICYSRCTNILEIGVGNGALRKFLSAFPEIRHTTLDINQQLAPDIVGSVLDLPLQDNEFDLIVCCEVLEHLPFDKLHYALEEIHRVTRHKVLISVPDIRRRIGIAVCVPKWQWLKWECNVERPLIKGKPLNREHWWEIGYKGTRFRTVRKVIRNAGFEIERTWRLEQHKWHCFFLLNKK